jgi:hypothetical protein
VLTALEDLERADPPLCNVEAEFIFVPLPVPAGEERDAVTDVMIAQIEQVVERLRRMPGAPGPVPDADSLGPPPDTFQPTSQWPDSYSE